MMKPGMKFDATLSCRAPTEGADPAHLRIECISFGKAGLPRRRRLVAVRLVERLHDEPLLLRFQPLRFERSLHHRSRGNRSLRQRP